jgi:hypothetical protein
LGWGFLAVAAVAVLVAVGLLLSPPSPAANGEPRIRQLTFVGDAEGVALDPGGTTVAFLTGQRRALVLREVDGDGELTLLQSDEPLGRPRWSPDASRLLFAGATDGRRGILGISRLGGAPALVASRYLGRRPQLGTHAGYDFAGNAGTVAIACCGTSVYVGRDPSSIEQTAPDSFSVGAGTLVALDSVVQVILDVTVSPDARMLAFVGVTTGRRTVLGLAATDGSEANVIATDESTGLSAWDAFTSVQWSPTGDQLYYVQSVGQGSSLMRVPVNPRRGSAAGPPHTVLPTLPAHVAVSVAVARGRVAYTAGPSRTVLELVELEAASQSRRVSRGTWTYLNPSLSPDGESLAYLKSADDRPNLFIMSLPDGEEREIADRASPWTQPSWSADGRRLAYISSVNDSSELRWVDLNTGEVRRVATVGGGYGATPAWLPDGQAILLLRHGQGMVSFDVATGAEMLVELTALRQVVTAGRRPAQPDTGADSPGPPDAPIMPPANQERQRPRAGPWGGRILSAVLSPTGTDIALFMAAPGQTGLWVTSLQGGQPRRLVDGNAVPLAWSNAGVIYFVRSDPGESGQTTVESIDATDGAAGPSFVLPVGCAAGGLSVSRDGRRAVCAVREEESDVWVVDNLDLEH